MTVLQKIPMRNVLLALTILTSGCADTAARDVAQCQFKALSVTDDPDRARYAVYLCMEGKGWTTINRFAEHQCTFLATACYRSASALGDALDFTTG